MRHIQPSGELRAFASMSSRLRSRSGLPGAARASQARGVWGYARPVAGRGELAGQIVFESPSAPSDLEPLGFRRTARVLLASARLVLNSSSDFRCGDVQVGEPEVRSPAATAPEVHVSVDEAAEIELPQPSETRPAPPARGVIGWVDHRTRDGIQAGARPCAAAPGRQLTDAARAPGPHAWTRG